ncbi:RNA 3'-terminal phosphate cyclase [Leptidea sinapis]|uniref:RNA 3'-terminal phosphate cyclase n=1 Tax=Leptidea sinapis TaxID=189913 RepID=UPI00213CD981|nr:RNA 3'-terminal phosphate cyclase [Leptidea sinapis]
MSQILCIDGSVLEGGGQILRMSVSLSAILRIPIRVTNIRANRSKPGLAAQHLSGIRLVADMCKAKVKGDFIGSKEIELIPGAITGGLYEVDTGTAGSISLLLQVALPCALFADSPVTLVLRGGTNVQMAPQIDYMEHVFRKLLNHFGADFNLQIIRRGYFPRGGGHVRVVINPVNSMRSVEMTTRGEVQGIHGWGFVSGRLTLECAREMITGASDAANSPVEINFKERVDQVRDECHGIILQCTMSSGLVLGCDALGRQGQRPYDTGAQCGRILREMLSSGTCLDSHAQDQLIIYMCIAKGESKISVNEITLHTKTAMHVAKLVAKVNFTVREEHPRHIIECHGLGLENKNLE